MNHSLVVLLYGCSVVKNYNFSFEFTDTKLFKRLAWVDLSTTLFHLISFNHINTKKSYSFLEGVTSELKSLVLNDAFYQKCYCLTLLAFSYINTIFLYSFDNYPFEGTILIGTHHKCRVELYFSLGKSSTNNKSNIFNVISGIYNEF